MRNLKTFTMALALTFTFTGHAQAIELQTVPSETQKAYEFRQGLQKQYLDGSVLADLKSESKSDLVTKPKPSLRESIFAALIKSGMLGIEPKAEVRKGASFSKIYSTEAAVPLFKGDGSAWNRSQVEGFEQDAQRQIMRLLSCAEKSHPGSYSNDGAKKDGIAKENAIRGALDKADGADLKSCAKIPDGTMRTAKIYTELYEAKDDANRLGVGLFSDTELAAHTTSLGYTSKAKDTAK